jgi:hypothetical protein
MGPKTLPVPQALELGFDQLTDVTRFPPFALLGRRDDASFRRSATEVSVDYEWREHSPQGPVARIAVGADDRVSVEEQWQGTAHGGSYGQIGLGKALQSRALSHAHRDVLFNRTTLIPGAGPGFTVEGVRRDVGPLDTGGRVDPFFERLLQERYGVAYAPPTAGARHDVDVPAGMLRAVVILSRSGDTLRLRRLLASYLDSQETYTHPWLPARLARGSCSHRAATVRWDDGAGGPARSEELEVKVFVGPWRAAIELVEHLAAHGWDFGAPDRPPAVLCYPEQLVSTFVYSLPGKGRVQLTPLLPPQEALGADGAMRPAPLGDAPLRRSGGSADDLARLRAGLDEFLPSAVATTGPWKLVKLGNPAAPVVGLSRCSTPGTPTTPVLFIQLEVPAHQSGADETGPTLTSTWTAVGALTRGELPMTWVESPSTGPVLVVPNLPFVNGCHDEEGFSWLLPDLLRFLDGQGTPWLVERCAMTAFHQGQTQRLESTAAGRRRSGW